MAKPPRDPAPREAEPPQPEPDPERAVKQIMRHLLSKPPEHNLERPPGAKARPRRKPGRPATG
jgi:hypothetical protein